MDNYPGILSLPNEVLSYIGSFLGPRDLLSLSETCHHLRKALNDNFIWRKYSLGGHVGKMLDSAGLVKPQFKLPENNTLEPLCEHRLCFCKQSRLLNNLRNGNFVQYSFPFIGYLSDFETQKLLWNRQITYKSIYLFTLDYYHNDSYVEAIKVFNIEQEPYIITTFKLQKHQVGYSVVIWFRVIGSKLVVCQDDWIDVYEIKLPDETFPLLHSVNMNETETYVLSKATVLDHFLLVENHTLNIMHVWNVENGQKVCDVCPKIRGSEFSVLGYSSDNRYILLSVEVSDRDIIFIPHIFVYNLELLKFTSFNLILNESFEGETFGLVNEYYVVFLRCSSSVTCFIHVYDHRTSALLIESNKIEGNDLETANIINNCLVLPTFDSVKIINLKDLQIVWEIKEEVLSKIFVHDIFESYLADVGYMNISDLCHLIIVRKKRGVEIWDFEKRIKVLDLPVSECVGMNDNCSKIIICSDGNLKVLNYW